MRKSNVVWTSSYINSREEVTRIYEVRYEFKVKVVCAGGTVVYPVMSQNEKIALETITRKMIEDGTEVLEISIIPEVVEGVDAEINVFGKIMHGVVVKINNGFVSVDTAYGLFSAEFGQVRAL